jgi:predicted metal-dependent phosphoesterase TrpH
MLAQEAGLAFLRGVEISTLLDGRLFHILAYGYDIGNSALTAFLWENRTKLDQQNDYIVRGLIAAGYEIDLDDYVAYEDDLGRGGWKVLNFLIDRRFCTGPRDYFEKLVNPLHLEWPPFPHPADAIAVIRKGNGVPILAHPGASLRRVGVNDETLHPFLDFGIAGLECYACYHDEATTRFCLEWCDRHDLLITGGSDSHGGFVGRELGVPAIDSDDLRLGELTERYAG